MLIQGPIEPGTQHLTSTIPQFINVSTIPYHFGVCLCGGCASTIMVENPHHFGVCLYRGHHVAIHQIPEAHLSIL